MTKRLPLLLLFVALLLAAPLRAAEPVTTVTLLHFSDYHSHAVPFWNDGQRDQGGIARAVAYLEREKRAGALVFSGGDMMNHGSPAWSDKYTCVEWSWMNGLVDAMAYGNHDADYGTATFQRCRDAVLYPILSANTVDAEGKRVLPAYVVLETKGMRIGVFAVAGKDFTALVKEENRPAAGARFDDPVAAARQVVTTLRGSERVDAVVMIGHEQLDDDYALAKAVPGIDVIFGTHSHLERAFTKIAGTATWFLSPYQYLTRISRVELTFHGHTLTTVTGALIPIGAAQGTASNEEPRLAAKVGELEHALEVDPEYAPLFRPLGKADGELGTAGQLEHDVPLGNLVTDVMRDAAKADVAAVTSSSFRQAIPPGTILVETLRAAMPYENDILVYPMRGDALAAFLRYSLAHHGTDAFSQLSGVRVRGTYDEPRIEVGGKPLDPSRIYRVAVTNFQALVAQGYRERFAGLTKEETGLKLRDTFQQYLATHDPVHAAADGRIAVQAQ